MFPGLGYICCQLPNYLTPVVSLFKEKTTIGVFRLIILSLVVHAHFFVESPTVIIPASSVFLHDWLAVVATWPPLLLALTYHVLIIIQALRLNYILGNNKLFPHTNFTVAMAYILFTGLLPAWCNITGALLANILIIWLIHLLCKLYNTTKVGAMLFNIGFLTGISTLLYPPSYPLLLIMLLGILILRPFKINQLFTYLIGAILPFYFLGSYLYLTGDFKRIWQFIPGLHWSLPILEPKETLLGIAILLIICLLGGFLYLQSNMNKLLIIARKCWIILFLLLLFLLPGLITVPGFDWTALLIIMPAAAAIAGNLFYYNQQKIFLSILFWLFIFSAWFYSFGGWQLLPK